MRLQTFYFVIDCDESKLKWNVKYCHFIEAFHFFCMWKSFEFDQMWRYLRYFSIWSTKTRAQRWIYLFLSFACVPYKADTTVNRWKLAKRYVCSVVSRLFFKSKNMYSSLNNDQMNDTSEESEHNSSVSDFKQIGCPCVMSFLSLVPSCDQYCNHVWTVRS